MNRICVAQPTKEQPTHTVYPAGVKSEPFLVPSIPPSKAVKDTLGRVTYNQGEGDRTE